ncbi:MAG TPA: hypothetical protein VE291_09000, partial [Terracidiphilus sp.]|nr:hypothetical protein [Terracidiphilus sp.]
KIAPPSTSAITYGLVLLAAAIIPMAWSIASKRLSWPISMCFVLLAGTYLLSPRPPAHPTQLTTYAMIYNRESYVLLASLLVCLFVDRREPGRFSNFVDGSQAGLLLVLLLYCKITYFAAGFGLALLSVLLYTKSRQWFAAAATAFLSVALGIFLFFHISLFAYLGNVMEAGRAQSVHLRTQLLAAGARHDVKFICLLFFCLAAMTWAQGRASAKPLPTVRLWLASVAIVAAALFIISGNGAQHGGADDPLYFVVAIICIENFRRANQAEIERPRSAARVVHALSVVLSVPLFCAPLVARDAESFAYTVKWDLEARPALTETQRFHIAPLRDFYVPPSTDHITGYWPARLYPANINDGIDLLRRHLETGDRVAVFGFANPFSYALGLPPAKDGNLWWDIYFDFDRKHHPTPDAYLGDAALVIAPTLTPDAPPDSVEINGVLTEIYGSYLHSHFHVVESTAIWTLYRRN